MDFLKRDKILTYNDDITFQFIESHARDIEYSDSDDDNDDNNKTDKREYTINLFGVSKNNESVCLTVNGFKPYFYVLLDDPSDKYGEHLKRVLFSKKYSYNMPKEWISYKTSMVGFEIVKKKKLMGFTNDELFTFVKISFVNQECMKKCSWLLNKYGLKINGTTKKFKLYESNLEPLLRFFHTIECPPGGWIKLPKNKYRFTDVSRTCQLDVEIDYEDIITCDHINENAKFRQFSFDIEVYSSDGSFPKPEIDDNYVIQIATTIQDFGTNEIHKHIINLGDCDPIDGVYMENYQTEAEVLMAWKNLVNLLDPDIILGYNIFGFDLNYMYVRSKKTRVFEKFSKMGRIKDITSNLVIKTLSSSAYGHNEYKLFPMTGRLHMDLYPIIKKEEKYTSYTLNYVSETILGDKKHDVPPKEMFAIFQSKDPKKMKKLAEYCIQDTLLPQRIINKRNTLSNLIEMAKVTYVPLTYLIIRGQQIKVFSILTKMAAEENTLVPLYNKPEHTEETGFQGATVLSAIKKAFFDPITGLDYASLYPGIMMDHNLCYNTIVLEQKYNNLENVKYEKITINNEDYHFAQTKIGLLPKILRYLLDSRKKAKKEMSNAKTDTEYNIANGKQLAYKVTCNSVYGFTGTTSTGMLPCKPIASAVTTIGRQMIDDAKEYAENPDNFPFLKDYGCEVIYGDSVTGDTPVLVKYENGDIELILINQIASFGLDNSILKSYSRPHKNIKYVWSDKGFTKIKVVMRHKIKPTAKLVHIYTDRGNVSVTDDHSLILSNGDVVKPTEIDCGDELLYNPYPEYLGTWEGSAIIYEIVITTPPKETYVYDLETKNHHFHAGTGDLIVHNTDSIYCKFKVPETKNHMVKINESMKIGKIVADAITIFLKKQLIYRKSTEKWVELEFEKVYFPLFLYAKKRYVGPIYMESKKGDMEYKYLDAKGIVLTRRDNCKLLKKIYKNCLECLIDNDIADKNIRIQNAINVLENHIKDLFNGKVDINDLSITKSLSNEYKIRDRKDKLSGELINGKFIDYKTLIDPNTTEKDIEGLSQSHARLARKMYKRDPGTAPKSGDRIPYVFIVTKNIKNKKDIKQWEIIEHTEYVIKNNIPINYLYYFDKQLKKPLISLFELLTNNTEKMFEKIRGGYERKLNKQHAITDFFVKK